MKMFSRLHPLAGLLIVLTLAATPSSAQTALRTFYGNSTGDSFGEAVAGLGDVNGDGVPDVAVSAPGSDSGGLNSGSVKVFSGRTGQLIRVFSGSAGSSFGASIAAVGDLDGDGREDLIVGAPFARIDGVQLVGEAAVISVAKSQLLYRFKGLAYLDAFGSAVSSAGDVDNDGIPDLQVGASDFFQQLRGYVRVFSGRDGSLLHEFRGTQAGDFLGASMDTAGDQDGDGHDDLLIGAPQPSVGAGYAVVYSGRTGAVLRTLTGLAAGDQFGHAVASLDDVDGDQVRELAVGAYRSDLGSLDAGSVTVYSGASGQLIHTFTGDGPKHWLGYAVADAGDVDGDGFGDLLVAAHGDNSQTVWTTYGRVYSHLDGRTVATVTVDLLSSDSIIQAVDALGDLDADGRDDYLLSDFWNDDVGRDYGAAWIVSGCPSVPVTYGQGCPGSGGLWPRLDFSGCPSPGELTHLTLSEGLGGAAAQVLVSVRGRALMGRGNCILLVAPPVFTVPMQLGGAAGVPGAGEQTLPIQIPPTSNLIGWRFNAQARVFDPGTQYGNAFSNGVEIVIQ